MKLTRDQAVAKHRKQWNWMADETGKAGRKVDEHEYFIKNGIEEIIGNCFCCEYTIQSTKSQQIFGSHCVSCPIDWGSKAAMTDDCLRGLYGLWQDSDDFEEAAKLARQIAELPARTDNISLQ